MNILTHKKYKSYDRLSRYTRFPYYYNTEDNKYMYGTTAHLKDNTPYMLHKVQRGDTYDKLALDYYNNPTYYWIILDFNRIQDPFIEPEEGIYIKIPTFSAIQFDI